MPGLLDPTNPYPDFLDPSGSSLFDSPEYRRMRAFDTLGGIGNALLMAGAQGMDTGTALAMGLAGGAQAGRGAEDRFLRRAMVNSQLTKNRQEIANDKAWRDMFSGAATAPSGAPAATPAPATPWSPTPQAKDLVDYLVSKGMPPMQAAVAVGNFQQESGLNPTQVHDSGTGYGLGGWRLERRDALNNYAKLRGGNSADPRLQADFFMDELKGRPEGQAFMQAQDPRAAASALMTYFRPAGWTPDNPAAGNGFDNRLQFAQALMPGGAPQIAQGGGEGGPVVPAQAQQPALRPQTMQEVIQTIPPGVRQMIGAMGRKEGMGVLMKYADPGSQAVVDTQSGQVVFIPKTMVGRDARYQPVEGEKLNIDRRRIQLDASNKPVTETGVVNEPYVQAQERISRAQGQDTGSKITEKLAEDAIKRSNDWQASGLKAQSAVGRLDALQSMLDQISTNRFKGTTAELKAAAKGAGIDLEAMGIKDDVGVTQAAQALTNMLALENRDPSGGAGMPGAMSDEDRQFLQQASPSITKDPAGNRLLIAIKKGDLQRQIDIAKFASEYKRSKAFKDDPAGLDDYVAQKIAGKDYYDRTLLPQQSIAPPGAIPSQVPAMRRYNPATGKIE